ncbi:VaFE repeat-containing surface-anchored protein [Microbacterium gorillae]|uniref:VaFE repeat-containing surface-anchored protein n=1 Tax=Microbacterium gorillae TaxID=1231063 RepID=UPI003D966245
MNTRFTRSAQDHRGTSAKTAAVARALPQRHTSKTWFAILAVLGIFASMFAGVLMTNTQANAAVPPTPVTAPFDAPLCENTTGNPAVDADGGPVTNLLSVFGERLNAYNAGNPVILYNNNGASGWTASGLQYTANPVCMVRYVAEVGGPVSSWSYCTFDRASACSWTNAAGQLERQGSVRPSLTYMAPDTRLTADQHKLQAYIIQNDLPVAAGPNGSGGIVPADTVANNDTPTSRALRQDLVHCIDNPDRSVAFCDSNMSPATQARILQIINATPAQQLSSNAPSTVITPGATGEITVTTTLVNTALTLTVSGGAVTVCGGPATLSGSTLVVDADATLPAQVTLCATRPDAGTVDVSISGVPPVVENVGYAKSGPTSDTLCQIFSTFEEERQAPLVVASTVTFADAIPAIGTTLVDSADGDQVLPWEGGTVVDTVSYTDLTPGVTYTVQGELMLKSTGAGTGITGTTTFTPTVANGTTTVSFAVPSGYAGEVLVAYETLFDSADLTTVVAEHADINDAAQTVTVSPAPAIGTTLVDALDGDHVLAWGGGTVVDTIAYQNLTPGVEYTVTGELMLKSDGSATGITATATFTPTTPDGTTTVSFTVPSGYAGEVLVAYETLFESSDLTTPVAEHTDINDAAQTVSVGQQPTLGTIATTDNVADSKILPLTGGTITDTVDYANLDPNVCTVDGCESEYEIIGELMFVAADGTVSATGITGTSGSFVVDDSNTSGLVTVPFVVTAAQAGGFAGGKLVVYETVHKWIYIFGVPVREVIAEHKDINDADQTVTLAGPPAVGTTLVDSVDGDHVLAWDGGTVVDTIAYENLTPGTAYTVTGELVLRSDGSSTGITGTATFTPTSPNGTTTVTFTVPAGFAGEALVAYETLFESEDLATVVAEHKDLADAAQTVTVDTEPLVPAIGTTLVDSVDGDHTLSYNGGTVVDTIAYQNLIPGVEYTVTGELMLKGDGSAAGITGTVTFTPTVANGTTTVSFTVPSGYAGEVLVAYETLFESSDLTTVVAEHKDLNDAAQTVTVEAAPPAIATTLVDSVDGDHTLSFSGGTVIDTIAYQNLIPGVEYTVTGELMLKGDGTATGITASATFTPTLPIGTTTVTFTVPSGYAGEALVAYETLFESSDLTTVVAEHKDLNDAAQTVTVSAQPAIGTTLVDSVDGDHVLDWEGGTVVDTIAYQNLTPGVEYTVTGELMLKSDGTSTGITASATFTPTLPIGTTTVTFTVPTGFAGEVLVAYETVFESADLTTVVAEHKDLNDAAQTVTVTSQPAIGTTLVDSADDDHVLGWNGGTLIDTIAYQNLTPGVEYTVTGELMLKGDGSATGITGTTTFTPTEANGTTTVTFAVPVGFGGEVLVAYEELFESADLTTVVAEHKDINDAAQTVTVDTPPAVEEPAIGTSLVDSADGDHIIGWNGGTVIDTIAYQNLTPGVEYTVTGELVLQGDGSATGITGTTTFTPTSPDGSTTVTFEVPIGFGGRLLVAYEELFESSDLTTAVAEHKDLNDAAQTITVENSREIDEPAIATSLVDSADSDHVLGWNGGTVIDTIGFINLTPGVEYTITGELMMKSDGSATGITGTTVFTPTEPDGTTTVTFEVPPGFGGEALVAYETLFESSDLTTVVAEHKDIDDAAQTVTVQTPPTTEEPAIGTSLVDSADGDHVLGWNGGTVIDTIAYQNLTPGTEYTVTGELMLKGDGTATGITGTTTFTPTEANGTTTVTFTVPSGFGGEVLVAYETLFESADLTTPVAEHQDIDDAAQTVTVDTPPTTEEPAIGTSLVDSADGDHVLPAAGGVVVDTVAYVNLTPGVKYTITGELMLKGDGSATGVTGTVTFTPTTADGSVEVEFAVPAGFAGEALVAYEKLFESNDLTTPVAVHEDINDAAQTVTVEQPTSTPTPTPTPTPTTTPTTPTTPSTPGIPSATVTPTGPTGLPTTGANVGPAPLIGAVALLGIGAFILIARRRANSQR